MARPRSPDRCLCEHPAPSDWAFVEVRSRRLKPGDPVDRIYLNRPDCIPAFLCEDDAAALMDQQDTRRGRACSHSAECASDCRSGRFRQRAAAFRQLPPRLPYRTSYRSMFARELVIACPLCKLTGLALMEQEGGGRFRAGMTPPEL